MLNKYQSAGILDIFMMDDIIKVEKDVLQKMCRTCLSEKGEKQPIFSEKKFYRGKLSLHSMLEEVASVQVLKDDGLPGTICLTCLQRLHNAFEFKEQCEKNNLALHKYLEQNNDVEEKASNTLDQDVLSAINCDKQLIPEIKIETEDEIVDTENMADDAFSSENCSSSGDGETRKVTRKRRRYLPKPGSKDEPTETSIYYKNENGIKIFPCPVCNTNFTQRIRWLRHSQIHNSTKPYVCRKCGKCYKTYVDLSSHWYLHTGEKPYVCDTCGKHYRRQENLRIHIRVHTGERPYLCPDCGKGFKHATELTIHRRTHAPEKHYTCEICGKKLMNLSTHMRAHMNYKPHECEHCGKKFTVKAYLERHLVVHTGAKPYICTACGKAFNRMSTLRTHALIHTNIRPHKCEICGRAFLQKHVLQSHMNTHRPQYIP